MWTRLEVVENTAEGPAFDRCELEGTVARGSATRWRVFYGEALADGAGWSAIRSRVGCAAVASERAPNSWTLRGSAFLVAEVVLSQAAALDHEVRVDAAFSIRKLTGFAENGAPVYETTSDKRTLQFPDAGSVVVPLLVANAKETEEFRVRELLLRFRAAAPGGRPAVEYGKVGVAADVSRAEILLDGGFVGRTAEGAVTLEAVRAGEREVVVRDWSGREARAVARVEKGGRTNVTLALLPRSPASTVNGMRALGRNPQGSEEFWREKDSAILVRIPGGAFRMGSPEGEGEPSEHPQHEVRVRGYFIDKTEVTWGQYRRFATETSRPLPESPVWGMPEDFPVSNVTWDDARAFCAWAGGRLPTEAEWERAARGDDSRRYPLGDDWDPWRCNTRDGGPHAPTAAGANPDCVSPYGVLDLAGGVWEWCADWYDAAYYAESPAESPTGPADGKLRVSRGGTWMSASSWANCSHRQGIDPGWPNSMRGFRCAQDDQGGAGQ